MKRTRYFVPVLVMMLVFSLLSESAAGITTCTVDIVSLKDSYKRSKDVFVGEVVSVSDLNQDERPDHIRYPDELYAKVEFRVVKRWKGAKSDLVVRMVNQHCNCPYRTFLLPKGQRLIAFADKYGYISICNMNVSRIGSVDGESVSESESDAAVETIKRLDRFWFRFWAGFYPF